MEEIIKIGDDKKILIFNITDNVFIPIEDLHNEILYKIISYLFENCDKLDKIEINLISIKEKIESIKNRINKSIVDKLCEQFLIIIADLRKQK